MKNFSEFVGALCKSGESIKQELTPEQTIEHCRAKLEKRYAGLSYSNEAAQQRADKKE